MTNGRDTFERWLGQPERFPLNARRSMSVQMIWSRYKRMSRARHSTVWEVKEHHFEEVNVAASMLGLEY